VIQFACPTCKATCSVDDKFAKRKVKCPKCGARVLHVKDSEVQLLTPGSPPTEVAAPAVTAPLASAPPQPSDATPVATAVVGEFVKQSESKQNTMVVVALVVLFTVVLSGIGLTMGIPLLAVTPIGVALTAAVVWLVVRRKKMLAKLQSRSSAGETTVVSPKQ
jgi:DNA-directed RNA polymerase subunit RPC12/RpoP